MRAFAGPAVACWPGRPGLSRAPTRAPAARIEEGSGHVELSIVHIEVPDEVNVIVGQAHFIKTVEDLHECLVGSSPHLRFGIAFCEASGPRLIRCSGNEEDLVELATLNAQAISAGHVFVVLLRNGYPVNVLNALKQVPE